MQTPPEPPGEEGRLAALRRLAVVGTAPEERFDRLTRLAQSVLAVPTALVSLVDAERAWFKSRQGLDMKEFPRAASFCAHAILGPDPFIVADASKDARFADSPIVTGPPNVRFYAGVPLRLTTGEALGVLCVLDRIPRALDARRVQLLRDLAALAAAELEGATLDVALRSARELLEEKTALAARAESLERRVSDLEAAAARAAEKSRADAEAARAKALADEEASRAELAGAARETLELRRAVESSALVVATDAAGRITSVNDPFVALTGYSREELVGKTHRLLKSGAHPDRFYKDLWDAISAGRTWTGEICNRAKGGELYWISSTITPEPGPDGKPARYVAILHDITQRKRAEARAAESAARLQAVLDGAIQVAVVVADPEGRISSFSKGAENLLGWEAGEMTGLSPVDLRLTEVGSGERTFKRKDGSSLPVNAAVSVLRGARGEPAGFLCVAVDAGEQAAARGSAGELARAKALFLSSMSREARSPLNAVVAMSRLLLGTALDERQREFAAAIRGAGGSLLSMIGDALDLSALEAGALPFEELEFDPMSVVEDVAALYAARAEAKGLELSALAGEGLPARVRGDAGRLRQALSRYADNAVKFTENGEIVLGVRRVSDEGGSVRLRFEVRDTGPGLDAAAQAKLFVPFSRADASSSGPRGGAGLGLALARKLAEAMRGAAGVASAPGKGSTFWCEASLPKGAAQAPAEPAGLAGMRVLIVDDNETSRQAAALETASWRMRPQAVADAEAALAALRAAETQGDPFIVALIDGRMPGMDGVQLAQEIKGDPALVAVRLVRLGPPPASAGGDDPASAGFHAAVPKPVLRGPLQAGILEALAPRPAGPAGAEPSWKDLSVLVADDNPVDRELLLFHLAGLGCEADAASDGREVLEAAARCRYDAVFMDCGMPGMDGFEATAALRARPAESSRKLAIFAVAASARDRDRCLAAGMDDCVVKPVRAEDLSAALARFFGVIEQSALKGLRALGDPKAVREIVDGFAADAAAKLSALRAAAAAGDGAGAAAAAHSLKGSSGTVGAKGVERLAARLEAAGREGRLEEAPALLQALDGELSEAVKLLRSAL